MTDRLPSLNALRALEAAGRHMSLTRAAEQLHVTPAAVSHQIRLLEKHLGVNLFERKGRAIVPTPAALAGMAELRRGFDHLAEGVRRMRENRTGPLLRVTSETTFAGNWLVPRLARFRSRYPDLDVLIDATARSSISGYAGVAAATRALQPKNCSTRRSFRCAIMPLFRESTPFASHRIFAVTR